MQKKMRGFTLIELVVVIVLLGITAVSLTTLITHSVSGYIDTANRQDSSAIARIALDRMARELRQALPQSIRISSNCLQFLPINSSFVYVGLNPGSANVQVIEPPGGYVAPAGTAYAAIYALSSAELYNLTAMKRINNFGTVASGVRTLQLSAGFAAPRTSPGERLNVVGNPVSFCFTANQLRRYTGNVSAAQPTPGAGLNNFAILADKIAAGTFTFNAGNWQNNALVTIALTIQQASSNNEQLQFDHEVWLRNVP